MHVFEDLTPLEYRLEPPPAPERDKSLHDSASYDVFIDLLCYTIPWLRAFTAKIQDGGRRRIEFIGSRPTDARP